MTRASHYGHSSYCIANYGHGWRWGSFDSVVGGECECYPKPLPFPFPLPFKMQLIDNRLKSRCEFLPVEAKHFIAGISAGNSHALFLCESGEVCSMGLPNLACLGLGAGGSALSPPDAIGRMVLPGNALINGACCADCHSFLTQNKNRARPLINRKARKVSEWRYGDIVWGHKKKFDFGDII